MDKQHSSNSMLSSLQALTPSINPAVQLWWELSQLEASGKLTLEQVLLSQQAIDEAIAQGKKEIEEVEQMTKRLCSIAPIPQQFPILPL